MQVQEWFSWLLLSTRGQPHGGSSVPPAPHFIDELMKPLQHFLLRRDVVLDVEQHAFGQGEQVVQFRVHAFVTRLSRPCSLELAFRGSFELPRGSREL